MCECPLAMLKSSLFATLLTVIEGALAVAVLVTAEDIMVAVQ